MKSDSKQKIELIRDTLFITAIAIYFLGFVYLYYYMLSFGISILANGLPPFYVFIFSYNVFKEEPLFTVIAVCLAFAAWNTPGLYSALLKTLHGRWRDSLDSDFFRATAGAAAVIVAIYVVFGAAFAAAHDAAMRDVSVDRVVVHEGVGKRLTVVETTDGIVHSSKDFERLIAEINIAGREKRVKQVGESADRVYLYVGVQPDAGANLQEFLRGDRVYTIEKSQITVSEDMGV